MCSAATVAPILSWLGAHVGAVAGRAAIEASLYLVVERKKAKVDTMVENPPGYLGFGEGDQNVRSLAHTAASHDRKSRVTSLEIFEDGFVREVVKCMV